MALSIRSFILAFLALSASRMRSRFISISARSCLSVIFRSNSTLSFLAISIATSRRRTIGRVRSGESPDGMHGLDRLFVECDRLVGIGLVQTTPFTDLGADLGVESLGHQRLGVLHRAWSLTSQSGLALSSESLASRPSTFCRSPSSSESPAAATSVSSTRARPLSPARSAASAVSYRLKAPPCSARFAWAINSSAWASTPNLPSLAFAASCFAAG